LRPAPSTSSTHLEKIITDCLAKEPDHRTGSASILREQPIDCADANSLTWQNARDRWTNHDKAMVASTF